MMCEFHNSKSNGLGDIWWTDKCSYFSSIDDFLFGMLNGLMQFGRPELQCTLLKKIIRLHWPNELKCYYRPTASLQLNNKRNTKYNITVT